MFLIKTSLTFPRDALKMDQLSSTLVIFLLKIICTILFHVHLWVESKERELLVYDIKRVKHMLAQILRLVFAKPVRNSVWKFDSKLLAEISSIQRKNSKHFHLGKTEIQYLVILVQPSLLIPTELNIVLYVVCCYLSMCVGKWLVCVFLASCWTSWTFNLR